MYSRPIPMVEKGSTGMATLLWMLCKMMVVSGRRYASQSSLAPTQTYI